MSMSVNWGKAGNTDYCPGQINIRNSFDKYERRIIVPAGNERKIAYGDKLFARLILKGKTILEFAITTISDLTELYSLLHSKCRGTRGLAKLYLRNMSRGWSVEKALMLYAEGKPAHRDTLNNYNSQPTVSVRIKESSAAMYFKGEVRQLSFHWEL